MRRRSGGGPGRGAATVCGDGADGLWLERGGSEQRISQGLAAACRAHLEGGRRVVAAHAGILEGFYATARRLRMMAYAGVLDCGFPEFHGIDALVITRARLPPLLR